MSDAETRSLVRAALLLLIVSLIRLGVSVFGGSAPASESGVLDELVARSEALAEDQAARQRPLAAGERLDPNRADARELDRLPGVGPATAEAIVEERRVGGPFRSPADLARVRGIGSATVAKLEKYLDLGVGPPSERPGSTGTRRRTGGSTDVNRADSDALQRLPGVGPVLAQRIVETRERAPFRTVDELTRVPGIGAATLARLRDLVTVGH